VTGKLFPSHDRLAAIGEGIKLADESRKNAIQHLGGTGAGAGAAGSDAMILALQKAETKFSMESEIYGKEAKDSLIALLKGEPVFAAKVGEMGEGDKVAHMVAALKKVSEAAQYAGMSLEETAKLTTQWSRDYGLNLTESTGSLIKATLVGKQAMLEDAAKFGEGYKLSVPIFVDNVAKVADRLKIYQRRS